MDNGSASDWGHPHPSDLLFAYGTLKKGGAYHHLIAEKEAEFVGKACTCLAYPLLLAEYPCLLDRPGDGFRVKGEVYRLPSLAAWEVVDWLEDHPKEYRRRPEAVEMEGAILKPWTYFYLWPQRLDPRLQPVEGFDVNPG
ncbi:MAG: gamma-glutamylcyclotransferase family protein [Oceanipulchritudo sp.]